MVQEDTAAMAVARRSSAPTFHALQRIMVEDEAGHSDGETITSPGANEPATRSYSFSVDSPNSTDRRRELWFQRAGSAVSTPSAHAGEELNAGAERGETDESQLLARNDSPQATAASHVFAFSKMYRRSNQRAHDEGVENSQSPPISFMTRKMKRNTVSSALGEDDSETAAYRQDEERLQTHTTHILSASKTITTSQKWLRISENQRHTAVIRNLQRAGYLEELRNTDEAANCHPVPHQGDPPDQETEEELSCRDFSVEIHSPREGTEMQEISPERSSHLDITVLSDEYGMRTSREGTQSMEDATLSEIAERDCVLADDDDFEKGADDCRICGSGSDVGELLEACECKGSVAVVHGHCLKRWIKERPDVKEAVVSQETFRKLICCEICKHPYKGEFGRLAKKAAKVRLARLRRQQQTQQERARRGMDALSMILRAMAIICGAGTVVASPFLFFQCHKMGSSGCAKLKGQPILLGIVAVICLALLVVACRRLATECQTSLRHRRAERRLDVAPINQPEPDAGGGDAGARV